MRKFLEVSLLGLNHEACNNFLTGNGKNIQATINDTNNNWSYADGEFLHFLVNNLLYHFSQMPNMEFGEEFLFLIGVLGEMGITAHLFIHPLPSVNQLTNVFLCTQGSSTVQCYSGCKCNGRHSSRLRGGFIWVGRWIIRTWNNWGETPGWIKSSVRVFGSDCKRYRNSEARKITQGEKPKSSLFERDRKKPLFLSWVSAVNSGALIALGKDWNQDCVIFHTRPGWFQHIPTQHCLVTTQRRQSTRDSWKF